MLPPWQAPFHNFWNFLYFLYLGRISKCICVFEQIVFVYLYTKIKYIFFLKSFKSFSMSTVTFNQFIEFQDNDILVLP